MPRCQATGGGGPAVPRADSPVPGVHHSAGGRASITGSQNDRTPHHAVTGKSDSFFN